MLSCALTRNHYLTSRKTESEPVRCDCQRPCGRRGQGRAAESGGGGLDRSRCSSGLLEPLLLELRIDLGLESISSPERGGQLVSPCGVTRADLRERDRASAPALSSVFTFAHTDPYLGFDLDAPRAAAPFGYGHNVDVGRDRARRDRHRHLVTVLLRCVELGLCG
jgi:hypothetical protein